MLREGVQPGIELDLLSYPVPTCHQPQTACRLSVVGRSRPRNNNIGYRIDPKQAIVDCPDAGHILRKNAKRYAFALVRYRTLEDDDSIRDDGIDGSAWAPRLFIDICKDALPDFRVRNGASWPFGD